MVPGLARVARVRWLGGRKPYSGRPASAGSSRPTSLVLEFATLLRATSLAVCWAPIRMMPRLRPRSAMSSSTSLIGLLPSRGAYLFSSSIMVNSGLPGPAASLRAVSAASTTPTTKRCARSRRLCRSTTVTCWSAVEICRAAGQIGTDERAQRGKRGAQPPDEGIDGAEPRHLPGPQRSGDVVGQPCDYDVHQIVVGAVSYTH